MDAGSEIEADVRSPGHAAPLGALLARLAADSDAASAYEQLRLRLVTFFRLRFPVEAEALADEAIDRLARRLEDGTQVENPAGYALGIARFLVLETVARHRKEGHAAREALIELELQGTDADSDPALPALRACLAAMEGESARLIIEYYAADGGGSRIERRLRLAESMGLTLNALRNRALRARLALEKCVTARLEGETVKSDGDVPSKSHTRSMRSPSSDERLRDDDHD
jgi:DNA-directed RNA polymerase specialized sigma24 family protein